MKNIPPPTKPDRPNRLVSLLGDLGHVIPAETFERVRSLTQSPTGTYILHPTTVMPLMVCPLGALIFSDIHANYDSDTFPPPFWFPSERTLHDKRVLSGVFLDSNHLLVAASVIREFTNRGDRPRTRAIDWMSELVPVYRVQTVFI